MESLVVSPMSLHSFSIFLTNAYIVPIWVVLRDLLDVSASDYSPIPFYTYVDNVEVFELQLEIQDSSQTVRLVERV